jgi:regulator of RNase E activity RraA
VADATREANRELAVRLRAVPTSSAKVILRKLGVERVVVAGVRPLSGAQAAAGPARTVRFLPAREDFESPRGNVQRALIDRLCPGDVLVIDAMGFRRAAVLGDMLAARARANEAAAVVADGAVRDLAGLRAMEITVHARGTHPDPSSVSLIPWETDVPVQCGGVLVLPGDFIIADTDAVVVVPRSLAEEVARRGAEMAARDEFSQRLLAAGYPLDEAYPVPEQRAEEFERFRRDGTVLPYRRPG